MLPLTPAGRAALLGIAVVTIATIVGAGLHLTALEREAERSTQRVLLARSTAVAAGLADAVADRRPLQDALGRYASADEARALVLFDPTGRRVAAAGAEGGRGVERPRVSAADTDGVVLTREIGGEQVVLAAQAVGESGYVVAAVHRGAASLPSDLLIATAVTATGLWCLLVGLLVATAWYTGTLTRAQLARLGERLAQGGADGNALLRHAREWLGPLADAFVPVATRFRQLGSEAKDVQEHLAALYQINPNYVVLCTFEGKVVEANPAFYAVTGLSVDAVRGARVESLQDAFPVEPLMDFAHRSLREGSAITGVEYALVAHDQAPRPVDVSIRSFTIGEEKMALFQASDRSREKTLERRIAAFHDSLDLMVDQRVQEIEAGQESLRAILDGAGVVVASFDASGATTGWNVGAQGLTGRSAPDVPHISAAAQVLGLSPSERTSFVQWFWSHSDDPFIARHNAFDADGATLVRQLIWLRVDTDALGRTDLRTLIGVEIPADLELGPPVYVTEASALSGLRKGRPASV